MRPRRSCLVLAIGGAAALTLTPWVGLAVVFLLVVVVASYSKTVYAYPGGGGAYAVSKENLGQTPALVAASALIVDYILTVSVSVTSGVSNLVSAFPDLAPHTLTICVGIVVLLTAVNLRGLRESGRAFAAPTYAFIAVVLTMLGLGLYKILFGDGVTAESAGYTVHGADLTSAAMVYLVLRAFASGCTALTGVEAISNGVPFFRKPRSRNAAVTLVVMGALAITMFYGVTLLATSAGVKYAEYPAELGLPADYVQQTVIAQLGTAVFGAGSFGFYFLQIATMLVLVLAANTAYNAFPQMASVLGRDGFLPRQLGRRGDRLVFSNGIILLAAFAALLIVAFDASVTRLVQLYILGVFLSFTLSQFGMVRHWTASCVRPRLVVGACRPRASINFVGAIGDLAGAGDRHLHQVQPRRVDRDGRDPRVRGPHAGHQAPLRDGRPAAVPARGRRAAAQPGARRGADQPAERTGPAGTCVRAGHSPQHRRGPACRARSGPHRAAGEGVVGPADPSPADCCGLALPRRDRPRPGLRPQRPAGEPARHRGGVRPRVRGAALVGACAAQPVRTAAQDPPAVPPGRYRDRACP